MVRNVWIAVPAYTGQVHLGTMRSLMTDMLKLAERGDRVTIFDESGNAMIAHARDMIVAQFLAGEGTDLVFVDDDVFWEAGGILKLVDAEVDFVAGVYRQRKDPEGYSVRWIAERDELWADPETGLLEVEGVPAGFLRVSRAALERMVGAYGEAVNAIGSIGGGTQDIDLESGNVVSATVDTSATTFTFSNPPASGTAGSFTLILTNGGSQTVNWPAAVDWAGGSAPTLTSSGVDILTFVTIDGGTTWFGFAAGLDMS